MSQLILRSQLIVFLLLSALSAADSMASYNESEPNAWVTGTTLFCNFTYIDTNGNDTGICIDQTVIEVGDNSDPSRANLLPLDDQMVGQLHSTRDYDWFKLEVTNPQYTIDHPVTPVYFGCDGSQGYYWESLESFTIDPKEDISFQVNYYFQPQNSATAALQSSYIVSPDSCSYGVGSAQTVGHMRFQMNTTQLGTYYVRVWSHLLASGVKLKDSITIGGDPVDRYTYYDKIVAPTADYGLWVYTDRVSGEQEPNDGRIEAYPLTSDVKATGQLATMYDHDWFYINNTPSADPNAPQKILLNFTCTASSGTYYLSAYDSIGVQLANYQVPFGQCSKASGFTFTIDTPSPASDNKKFYFVVSPPTYTDTTQFTRDDYTIVATLHKEAIVQPSADLSVTLDGAPNPVGAGSNLTLTAKVTNNGPSAAAKVTVTYTLPSGVSFASGDCSVSGSTVTCTLGGSGANAGSLAPGQSATQTLVVTPSAAASGAIRALVADTATIDSNTANNQATLVPVVTPVVGLGVALDAAPDPVVAGSPLILTASVSNGGPSAATGIHVKLNLPDGMSFTSGSGCAATANVVDCTVSGKLDSGSSTAVAVKVTPTVTGDAAVTATVSSNETTGTSQSTRVVTVKPGTGTAELSISLAGSPSSVVAGSNLALTSTVRNSGPSPAANVHIVFSLPAGTSFVSGNGCSASGPTVDCVLGSLVSGQTATHVAIVTPTSASAGGIAATVSDSGTTDPNTSNNQATLVPTITALTGLSVALAASPDPAAAAAPVTLTATASNGGPSAATGVHVKLSLPSSISFTSGDGCAAAAGVVDCALGTLAANQSLSQTVVVTPAARGDFAITAAVSANEANSGSGNTQVTKVLTVNATGATSGSSSDLSIALAANPGTILAGNTVEVVATVTNNGPSAAINAYFDLSVPPGTSLLSGTSCVAAGAFIRCSVGDLAAGATRTKSLTVTPSLVGTVTFTAIVASDQADPNSANDEATASATVTSGAVDLKVSLSADINPVVAGSEITYKAVVSNNGYLTKASKVKLTVAFPENSISLLGTDSSCALSGTTMVCDLGTLAFSGGTAIRFIHGTPASAGTLTAAATVTSLEGDANPADNQAALATVVLPQPSSTTTAPTSGGSAAAPVSNSPAGVISPTGGDLWRVKRSATIEWNPSALPSTRKVTVSLSRNNGATWKPLKSSIKNTGSTTWKVGKAYVTTRAVVRVCPAKSSGGATPACILSDGIFTIAK